jgi:hypothetical protein
MTASPGIASKVNVHNLNVRSGDRYLIPGDIHFDQHDPDALDLMLNVAAAHRVNGAILVGDTFESAGISRHGRPGRKFRFGRGTIAAEEKAATPYVRGMRDIVRAYRDRLGGLHVLTGNHEDWWAGVQDEYIGLTDTPWFELYGPLFDGWHVHDEHTSLRLGPLLVCHGHRLRGSLAKYSAASVLANYPGQNTLYGHTHRIDTCITPSYKYGDPVLHGAWTIGHMRDVKREHSDRFSGPHAERHRQGFAIVDFHEVEGDMRFGVNTVNIDRSPSGNPYCIVSGILFDS